jgi:ComF family protein
MTNRGPGWMRPVVAAPHALGALAVAGARDLAAWLAPQLCPGCGARTRDESLVCTGCLERIPKLADVLCVRCLLEEREPVGCARHARAFRAVAAWIYDERAALVVQALKFGARPGLAAALGEPIARSLPRGYRPDMVIEVPLHAARRRERGYDQAARLADAVARAAAAPHVSGLLARVRPTAEQSRLPARRRRVNLDGAFRAPRPEALAGRRVLVVDDVLTTGATLAAALATVRDAGGEPLGATLAWAG